MFCLKIVWKRLLVKTSPKNVFPFRFFIFFRWKIYLKPFFFFFVKGLTAKDIFPLHFFFYIKFNIYYFSLFFKKDMSYVLGKNILLIYFSFLGGEKFSEKFLVSHVSCLKYSLNSPEKFVAYEKYILWKMLWNIQLKSVLGENSPDFIFFFCEKCTCKCMFP